MSRSSTNRRRTYKKGGKGNNIGIAADFVIRISKTESNPTSMITVDGDPTPLLNGFRRCLAKSTEDNKINICYLDDSNSNFYENGEAAVLTGAEGDVMVYFPEFFYKGTDTDSEWVFNITTTQVDKDSYQDLGWHYAPASLVGVYKAYISATKVYSRSGVSIAQHNYEYSTYARNRGAGFHIIDYQQHCIIAWMFYARYKRTDSVKICGTGPSNIYVIDTDIKNGTSNNLGITDTTASEAGASTNVFVNFLGVEGCWGYYREYIEGIHCAADRETIIAYDKGDFINQSYNDITSSTKRILLSMSSPEYSSGYISKIKGGEYMDMFCIEFNGSSNTYFCESGCSTYGSNYYTPYRFFRSNHYDGPGGYLMGLYNEDYDLDSSGNSSRLAFDGEITIIESPSEFKSISKFR